MSLLIPDAQVHNLYCNGQKIKAAYLNGENVWTEKHRVEWRLDDAQTTVKSEYVTDGHAAVPPVIQDWTDEYHCDIINAWDTPFEHIGSDTVICAQSSTPALYLLRNGYGINYGLTVELTGKADRDLLCFGQSITFTDLTSGMGYGSAEYGQSSVDGIRCRHTVGKKMSDPENFCAVRYRAALLDARLLRSQGYTKLRFTGSFRFGSGEVLERDNLRVAFVALQSTAQVTTTTDTGLVSDCKWQAKYNVNTDISGLSVPAVSGVTNGTLDIPERGSFYVIAGELTSAFKGTGEISINNMWVE